MAIISNYVDINLPSLYLQNWVWSDNIVGKVFVVHVGTIPGTPHGTLSVTRVILNTKPGISPEYKWVWLKNQGRGKRLKTVFLVIDFILLTF